MQDFEIVIDGDDDDRCNYPAGAFGGATHGAQPGPGSPARVLEDHVACVLDAPHVGVGEVARMRAAQRDG